MPFNEKPCLYCESGSRIATVDDNGHESTLFCSDMCANANEGIFGHAVNDSWEEW